LSFYILILLILVYHIHTKQSIILSYIYNLHYRLFLHYYHCQTNTPIEHQPNRYSLGTTKGLKNQIFLYAKSNIKFVLSNNFFHDCRVVTKNLYRFLTFLMKIIQFQFHFAFLQNKIPVTLEENQ